MNRIVFEGANCKSLWALNNSIITLAKYSCGKKGDDYQSKLNLILPQNITMLPVQVLWGSLESDSTGEEAWSGEGTKSPTLPLLKY
jgi:hypothetical protein